MPTKRSHFPQRNLWRDCQSWLVFVVILVAILPSVVLARCKFDSDCEPNTKCLKQFGTLYSKDSPWILNGIQSQCVREPVCGNSTFGNCATGQTCWRIPSLTPSFRDKYEFGCVIGCGAGMHRPLVNSERNNCPWTGYGTDKVDVNLRKCVYPPFDRVNANETDRDGNTFISNPAPPLCKLNASTGWGEDLMVGYTGEASHGKAYNLTATQAWVNNCSTFESRSHCEENLPICRWKEVREGTPCEQNSNCISGLCNNSTKTCSSACTMEFPKVCLPCLVPPFGTCEFECERCPENTFKNMVGDATTLCRPCPEHFSPDANHTECCFEGKQSKDGTCVRAECRYTEYECKHENCKCVFPSGREWGGTITKSRKLANVPYSVYPYDESRITETCNDLELVSDCGPSFLEHHWLYGVIALGGLLVLAAVGFGIYKLVSSTRRQKKDKDNSNGADLVREPLLGTDSSAETGIELPGIHSASSLHHDGDGIDGDGPPPLDFFETDADEEAESIAIILAEESRWNDLLDHCKDRPNCLADVDNACKMTPLHWTLVNMAPVSVVKSICELYPAAVRVKDANGALPLHIALQESNTVLEIVQLLVKAYPTSVDIPFGGQTCLQLARENHVSTSIIIYLEAQ